MRWYRPFTKTASDDIQAQIDVLLNGQDMFQRMTAAKKLGEFKGLDPSRIVFAFTKAFMQDVDQVKTAVIEAMVYILGRGMDNGPARDAYFKAISQIDASTSSNVYQRALAQIRTFFKDKMHSMVPKIKSCLKQYEDGNGGIASREAIRDAMKSFLEVAKDTPSPLDRKLTFDSQAETVKAWNSLKGSLVPGTKLKLIPKAVGFEAGKVVMAKLLRIEYTKAMVNGKPISLPKLVVEINTSKGPKEEEINVLASAYNIFVARSTEDLSLDEYTGHWVSTTDPVADSFKQGEGSPVGILMKKTKDSCTLKMMKGRTPWVIAVPCSTVRPTSEAPEWGRESFQNNVRFTNGDIVSLAGTVEKYLVVGIRHEEVGIRPLQGNSHNVEWVPTDKVEYLGRMGPDGKIVSDPHLKSKSFAPVPPQKPAPSFKPQQKPADPEA